MLLCLVNVTSPTHSFSKLTDSCMRLYIIGSLIADDLISPTTLE